MSSLKHGAGSSFVVLSLISVNGDTKWQLKLISIPYDFHWVS